MTKEKILEILNKKIEAVKKDVNYWYTTYQISSSKLDLLEGLVDELLKLEEVEELEKGEQKNGKRKADRNLQ